MYSTNLYTAKATTPTIKRGTMEISGFCEEILPNGKDNAKEDRPINANAAKPSNHELHKKHSANVTSNSTVAPAMGKPSVMTLSSNVATMMIANMMAYFATLLAFVTIKTPFSSARNTTTRATATTNMFADVALPRDLAPSRYDTFFTIKR